MPGTDGLPARYLERLVTLVGIDSGSGDLAGLHRVAVLLGGWAEQAGMAVELVPVASPDGVSRGEAVLARVRGTGRGRILFAGHLDTVYPPGEAARRPVRIHGNRAYGPGVSDDKGGVLAGLAAIEVLLADRSRFGELVLLANPDEEDGSPGSRPLLDRLAAGVDAALCLESARENGDLVRARKGVADVEVSVRGRAAHAGVEPERGANAALAAAHLTVALQALNGSWPQVTVNVGVLRAGHRPNVVAEHARLLVDVRSDDAETFAAVLAAIHAIAAEPTVPGVTATVAVHQPTPPWRTTPEVQWLLDAARTAGGRTGVPVRFAATGGCADANLLARNGLAVLDGLGPVGGDDHGPAEWLDLTSVAPRVALLAELASQIGRLHPGPTA
jgi:glutamate carboxypeptidase